MNDSKTNISVRDLIQLDSELLDNISSLAKDHSEISLLNIFADLHNADIAEIINNLKLEHASYIFRILDTETASEVITEIDENLREKILKSVDTERITDIVDELETDDATDIVSDLPEQIAEHVLQNIDEEDSADVKVLLQYDEDTAGGIMSTDFVFVSDEATVMEAVEEVRINSEEYDHIYHIYVLTRTEKLVGYVLLKSLLTNKTDTKISSIMEEDLIYVNPDLDQEEVANVMEKYDLVVVPVVDEERKMLGRITIDDIVDVIQEEADEDIQKIAGLSEDQETSDSVFRISRIRLPWLIISLIMELVSAVVLQSYEATFKELIIATFFIPVVMAMGGSSGTQAAIVMVRGLGAGDIWVNNSFKRISKEFFVALLNGAACGAVLIIAVALLFPGDQLSQSFTILLAVSLLIIIVLATMVGATVPIFLKSMGVDPAIAAGPFVTTTNDIVGLLIYLSLITLFLPL